MSGSELGRMIPFSKVWGSGFRAEYPSPRTVKLCDICIYIYMCVYSRVLDNPKKVNGYLPSP